MPLYLVSPLACTRSGSFTHVIAAHSLADLRTKTAAAEQPAPQRGHW
jgi:hypothetical protein